MTPLAESLAGLMLAISGAVSPPVYDAQPTLTYSVRPYAPYSGASSQYEINRRNAEVIRESEERERDQRYEHRIEQLEYKLLIRPNRP